MVNTLALLLSSEERQRSRYAVETLSNDSDSYDSDLFVQGLLKVLLHYLSILLQVKFVPILSKPFVVTLYTDNVRI